eukprot:scaffold582_cov385-Prasinococcus_capsulatus_cf.AAC.39
MQVTVFRPTPTSVYLVVVAENVDKVLHHLSGPSPVAHPRPGPDSNVSGACCPRPLEEYRCLTQDRAQLHPHPYSTTNADAVSVD